MTSYNSSLFHDHHCYTLVLCSKIIIHQSQDIFMLHLLHLGFGRLMRLSEIKLKYIN